MQFPSFFVTVFFCLFPDFIGGGGVPQKDECHASVLDFSPLQFFFPGLGTAFLLFFPLYFLIRFFPSKRGENREQKLSDNDSPTVSRRLLLGVGGNDILFRRRNCHKKKILSLAEKIKRLFKK